MQRGGGGALPLIPCFIRNRDLGGVPLLFSKKKNILKKLSEVGKYLANFN